MVHLPGGQCVVRRCRKALRLGLGPTSASCLDPVVQEHRTTTLGHRLLGQMWLDVRGGVLLPPW